MKYKVTGLIVCALIAVTVLFLSCEKNPVAPEATSDDIKFESAKTRWEEYYDLNCCNDKVSSLRVSGDTIGESYVILYDDYNYQGSIKEVFIAEDPNLGGWLWRPGNKVSSDVASSVKLVRGATCILYRDCQFKNPQYSITLTQSCSDLRNYSADNSVSSIKVGNISAKGVVLYEHYYASEYGTHPGRSDVIINDDPNLGNNYILNDHASMIKLVNIGTDGVTLYKNYNYGTALNCWE